MTDQSLITLAENFGAEVGRYEGKAVWIKFHSSTDLEAFAAALTREQEAQPAYPEGEVVGPCVCGSWPGGKCLKCKWIPAQPAAQEPAGTKRECLWTHCPNRIGDQCCNECPQGAAQPAAQGPDELLRDWIKDIGVNPELNRWHVSREDVLQLIRAARSKP